MNSKKVIIGGIVFIVAIVLLILAIQFSQVENEEDNGLIQQPNGYEENGEGLQLVNANHYYADGRHIIAGEIDLPTPCYILDHEVMVLESFPESVSINLNSRVDEDYEICAQVITPYGFVVEFQASAEASISAYLDGQRINLNIKESSLEDIENLEFFIKG